MDTYDRLVYTNDNGQSIEISYFSFFIPENFTEETSNNISTVKDSFRDGCYITNDILEAKFISISGVVNPKADIDVLRRDFKKIFNPKLNGTLIFSSQSLEKDRVIKVKAEEVPSITKSGDVFKFSIDLMAASPFWEEQEKVEIIALLTPKMHFPLIIKTNAFIFGTKKSVKETEVNNIGDVNTGLRMVFKARGQVDNPCIKNAITGEYIKLNYSMKKDDMIEVINYPNQKKITINQVENGFKYLDLDSTFFELETGKNLIGYDADLNPINLDVILYYTPRFLGV